jgi:hypothetical protein
MTKSIFLCAIQGISVKEDLGDGIEIVPHDKNSNYPRILLTNNLTRIQGYSTDEFQQEIGLLEHRSLFKLAPLVAFSEGKFDESKLRDIQYLIIHLNLLRTLFYCLWTVKDNSADYDLGFLHYENKYGKGTASNQFTGRNYNCVGEYSAVTEFNVKEITEANHLLRNYLHILEEKPNPASSISIGKISVSNYFVQAARNTGDLGLKITNYCSSLETLFTNDTSELSHKLAERVSLFLEKETEKRIGIFRVIKKAYEFRSRVVHGGMFKKEQAENLRTITIRLDEICRRVMYYCYTTNDPDNIFEFPAEKQEEYFLRLIMSS